jgi:large subunit ribosomal protein L2
MNVLKAKPITPGSRFRIKSDFSKLTKHIKPKKLLKFKHKTGGRNNSGKMTMRYIGGGHKKKLREIDFKRQNFGVKGKVVSIEYDPYRTAFIALVNYSNGDKRYIIAPEGLKVGDTVTSGKGSIPEIGCTLQLNEIPTGTFIHNIELNPGAGAKIVRSAGCYAQLLAKDGDFVSIKLPSGETRLVNSKCLATVGIVSNGNHMNEMVGKAGRNRWKGIRPRVRGVAMNPVDHPMGGGEGKASGGHPRSRNGKPAKGLKTRKPNKYSDKLITSRKK